MNFSYCKSAYRKSALCVVRCAGAGVLLPCFLASAVPASAQNVPPPPKPIEVQSTGAAVNLPSEATVDSFLQATFGYDAKVRWKVSSIKPSPVPRLAQVDVTLTSPQGQQVSRFYITADGEHAVVGDIIPFGARPFDPARKTLEMGITGPARGPKEAAVTIVEFGDLQCPACKAAQPAIEGLIAAEPNARFVFQNFPLDMHNWAAKGAAYADCVGVASTDAFWKFITQTYATQADITAENVDEKLTALAEAAGLNGVDIAACAKTPGTEARVEVSLALGKLVGVTGTPTLFINGRSIGNISQVPAETLKRLVDFAFNDVSSQCNAIDQVVQIDDASGLTSGPGHCTGEADFWFTNTSSQAIDCAIIFHKSGRFDPASVVNFTLSPGEKSGGPGKISTCGSDTGQMTYRCFSHAENTASSCTAHIQW